MKYFKYLIILFLAIFIIPFGVFAEEQEENKDENSNESKAVPIYFFKGDGCSHCAEAEEWFESIKEEYGSFFELMEYETWYNEDNAALMEKVATARGESAEGVTYIIVGNKSWNGFADDYKDEILSEIKSVFEQDIIDRYDIMKYLTDDKNEEEEISYNDVVDLFLMHQYVSSSFLDFLPYLVDFVPFYFGYLILGQAWLIFLVVIYR